MLKFTPSTARTMLRGRPSSTRFSHGADTSKVRFRPVTSSIGTVTFLWPASDMGALLHQPAGDLAVARRHRLRTVDIAAVEHLRAARIDRKSTRLNSSH